MNIPHEQVCLIGENWCLQVCKVADRGVAMVVGLLHVFGPQRNLCQQQLSQHNLVSQVECAEGFQRFGGKAPRLEETSLVVEDQSTVQVDQGRPCLVFFPDEDLPGFRKKLEALEPVPLLAGGDGGEGQTFGALISHVQFLEALIALSRKFGGVCTEVQFEIEFRQVEVAQRKVVRVTYFRTRLPCGAQHFDGFAVFTPLVVQVGNVVVRLRYEQWHPVLLAELASLPISLNRLGKSIQADITRRQVA